MKTVVKWLVVLLVVIGGIYGASIPVQSYLAERNKVLWRTDKVAQGNIKSVVNSTGSIKPKLQVAIGSFVSGPIIELAAEFNQEVKEGDLLARIDPLIYRANVARDAASLASRKADVLRMKAQLQQAINDEKRAVALRTEDPTFIAQAEMDKYKFTRLSMDAQLESARTSVAQAQATLENSEANLKYTEIRAPVDGMVINRKIDPGQTVAAQFQTPELFVIAPDMRKEMYVHASVDEADIGLIKSAQREKFPVSFTVDAYPDELFEGHVYEVRLSSSTSQNVVTYPVIVSAPNPELKLLPGMTASISFQVAFRDNVVKIPNGALRFYPDVKHVRAEDISILEGHIEKNGERDEDQAQQNDKSMSASERSQLRKDRDRRHVWVQDGQKLRAVAVTTGLGDSQYTELLAGDLRPGDVLVTGIKVPSTGTPR
jgi:HlyD family secretion protein